MATTILLNGASSSGKTSLARALQGMWPGPLAHVGIDTIISMLDPAYTGGGAKADLGFPLVSELNGSEAVMRFEMGPVGRILNSRLAAFAAGLNSDGVDVVIDHVLIDDDAVRPFARSLDPVSTHFIAVRCDASVALERERARGDRATGLVRDQLERVHAGARWYDHELDSTHTPSSVLADQLMEACASQRPNAIARLREHWDFPAL